MKPSQQRVADLEAELSFCHLLARITSASPGSWVHRYIGFLEEEINDEMVEQIDEDDLELEDD